MHENILNINLASFACTFIAFTTQKLNKNEIRLSHILLVYLLQTLFLKEWTLGLLRLHFGL